MNKVESLKLRLSNLGLTLAVAVASLVLAPLPASAAVQTTINGVIYSADGSGTAQVTGYTTDLPFDLSIESNVDISGSLLAVSSIAKNALADATDLASVVVPASISGVGVEAFSGDTSLTTVVFEGEPPVVGDYAFLDSSPTVYYHPEYASPGFPEGFTNPWNGLAVIALQSFAATSVPTIGGSTIVGETLSGNAGAWDSQAALTYQWLRDGQAIANETAPEYFLSSDDLGHRISLRVSGSALGFITSTHTSLQTDVVAAWAILDGVVYATTGSGTAFVAGGYEFLLNYVSINPTVNILGNQLPVTAIAPSAFANETELTAVVIPNSITTIGESAFQGATKLTSVEIPDSVVTVGPLAFDGASALTSVRIGSGITSLPAGVFGNDAALSQVTFAAAPPTLAADSISASPTIYYYPAYSAANLTGGFSNPWHGFATVALSALTLKPTPLLSGVAQVGRTLTATPGAWDSGVSLTYEWKRDGVVIGGVAEPSYTLIADDFGALITVTVIGSKLGFGSESATSLATGSVQAAAMVLTPTPVISGSTEVGQVLTVDPGVWDDGVTTYYQWLRNGVAIEDGASSTEAAYLLTGLDLGSVVSVMVLATKPGFADVSKTSASSTAVLGFQLNGVFYAAGSAGEATIVGFADSMPTDLTIPATVTIGGVVRAVTEVGFGAFSHSSLGAIQIPASVTNIHSNAFESNASLSAVTFLGAPPSMGTSVFLDSSPVVYYQADYAESGYAGGFTNPWFGVATQTTGVISPAPTPTVDGIAKVGEFLNAVSGVWDENADLSYQWQRDGAAITGAVFDSYLLNSSDFGHRITVSLTATKAGSSTVQRLSDPTADVALGSFWSAATPRISGTMTFGQTLTGTVGEWDQGTVLSYQWKRNGAEISGATGLTHSLTLADIGTQITFAVTGAAAGYETTMRHSATTDPVQTATQVLTPTPTVSGTTAVGNTLTAASGAWDSGVTLSYQWLRNGTAILGATASSYQLVGADFETTVSVQVTGAKTGFTTVTRASAATPAIAVGTLNPLAAAIITGDPFVSAVLHAVASAWDALVVFTYQWFRGGSLIAGATNNTYTITSSDLGLKLTVSITGTKLGYTSMTKISAATARVGVLQKLRASSSPNILGDFVVGNTLTANTNQWDSGVNFTYQWNRGGTAIPGATSRSYVLAGADFGQSITLTLTGSKLGYLTVSKTSSTRSPVRAAQLSRQPTPTISGKAKVGSVLTSNPGTWDSGVTLSYQWKRWGTAIPGATGATFTPTSAQRGATICVTVTATKLGYVKASRTSSSTNAVER